VNAVSFEEAQQRAEEFLAKSTADGKTVSDLITNWRVSVKPTLKLSTQRSYAWAFQRIEPAFGSRLVGDITKSDVQAFLTTAGKDLSGKSIRDLRCWLRALLSLAVEWEWIKTNPAAGRLRLPEVVPVRRKVVLQPGEFEDLAAELRQPYSTVVTLAVFSGLRQGELEPLRWDDVSPGRVRVDEAVYQGVLGTPKTRRSRRHVTIGPRVQAALETWRGKAPFKGPRDFVFAVETNSPIGLHNVMARHIKPACKRLGLPSIGWHDLRHTFTTWGRRAGVPVEAMRDQLGHTSAVLTLDVYSHAGEDQDGMAEAIEQYARKGRKTEPQDPKPEPLGDLQVA
jgi:integrase